MLESGQLCAAMATAWRLKYHSDQRSQYRVNNVPLHLSLTCSPAIAATTRDDTVAGGMACSNW